MPEDNQGGISAVNYFYRVGAMAKIIFFEFVAAASFSSIFANLFGLIFLRSCNNYHGELAWYQLFVLFFAYLAAQGVIMRIWYAKYSLEGINNVVKLGGWILPNVFLGRTAFYMPLTHPIYILIDIVTAGVGAFFVWANYQVPQAIGACGWNYHYYFGWSFLTIGLGFALFRLFSWYVLKRQVPKDACKGVWWPVLIFWLLVAAMVVPGVIVSMR